MERVLFICFGLLSWLGSSVITRIENELNNLEMMVKIIKRKHWLYSDTINTPLGVGTSVSLDRTWNLRDFLKCLAKLCWGQYFCLCNTAIKYKSKKSGLGKNSLEESLKKRETNFLSSFITKHFEKETVIYNLPYNFSLNTCVVSLLSPFLYWHCSLT